MSLNVWLLFALTEGVLCLVPGPAVLFVMATGLARGFRHSLAANLAILSANTLYFAISATSLGALIVASYELFFAVKWIGAAYLVYLAVQTFRSRTSLALSADQHAIAHRPWKTFVNGFVVQAANPKSILFFTALLPQFIDPAGSLPTQILILGLTSVAIEFLVLAGYGALAGRASHLALQPRFVVWSNRAAGGLLASAAAMVAVLKRS